MIKLDEKDCLILNILQINCRESLTDISKKVGLSIDSVNKRIKKLMKNNVYWPKIQIRPRNLGFKNIVDVKIKLRYNSKQEIDKFIAYLRTHPRVAEIFSVSGEWDFSIVIIAKDPADLSKITSEIRFKFGEIIVAWTETLTTNSFKFEYYDVPTLMGFSSTKTNPKF